MSTSDLSVDEALARLLHDVSPLSAERLPLDACLGRVLAEDVIAPHDLPALANSAMDGYAARAEDIASASKDHPVTLEVVGEVAGGHLPATRLDRGQAMRISTGAALPDGADTVVPVEDTSEPWPVAKGERPAIVRVTRGLKKGAFVRPAGLDVRAGARAVAAGQRLRPQDIALLAAVGCAQPLVYRKPRLAVFATGDELQDSSVSLAPGRVRDANSPMLIAAARAAGAEPLPLGIVPDTESAVRAALARAVEAGADVIVSSAGVSVGPHDVVRQVLQADGDLEFWRVNIRPGKPLAVGRYRGVRLLGLPGNPVSAFVSFEVFVRPVLRRLEGEVSERAPLFSVRLEEGVESDGRESYLRARVWWQDGEYRARLAGGQDSSMLSTLVAANALVRLPAGVRRAAAGELIDAWWLPPGPTN
ncbi:MAG: gephyrin-like molybdotransferase Glp [Chloroflexota bacterium]